MIRSYLRDGPWLFHHQLLLNQAQCLFQLGF